MTDKDDRRRDEDRPWDKSSKGGPFSSAFDKGFGKGKPKEVDNDSTSEAQEPREGRQAVQD